MSKWWLLFALGILMGCAITALVQRRKNKLRQSLPFPKNYLQGLNFLLNEEPDKAVDLFIKMLAVDDDTVETHLALGNLFCRRGEVSRAIRIHQNLIARPSLGKEERTQALLALAKDYLSIGVLDRAERLFQDLISLRSHLEVSLRCLLDIYQQEKKWSTAIAIAQQLYRETGKSFKSEIAYYYCELAEVAIDSGSSNQAHRYLRQALSSDDNCARASLLLGSLEYVSGRHKHAIRLYKQVSEKNPDFLSESIVPLVEAYQALGEEEALAIYIDRLLKKFPRLPIILLLVERFNYWRNDKKIQNLLLDYVKNYPSLSGLHQFIELKLSTADEVIKPNLEVIYQLTSRLLLNHPHYQCEVCGFFSQTIRWLCPSCKRWGVIKSIYLFEEVTKQTP